MTSLIPGFILTVVLLALFALGLWLAIYFLLPHLVAAGTQLSRWLTRKIVDWPMVKRALALPGKRLDTFKVYLPMALVVLVGGAVALKAGEEFLDLAEALRESSPTMERFDQSEAHSWAGNMRGSGATVVFNALTVLGTPPFLAAYVFAAAALLVRAGQPRRAGFLVLTTTGGGLLNLALKSYFARARPDLSEALRHASGYSFPSGHAMGSIIVFGALAYCGIRAARGWKSDSAIASLAITLILAISFSRIYLGVHWISDIAAGLVAGLVWLTTMIMAYEVFRRIVRIRSRRANLPRAD